jgi:hypothetical protein
VPDNQNSNQTSTRQNDEHCDLDRRQAMKKMGKYAAYTAPAMLTLFSKKSVALPISF